MSILIFFACIAGCTILSSLHYSGQWVQMTSQAEWEPRSDHNVVVLPDDSIVLIGGTVDAASKNDVWRSTDKGASWRLLTNNAEWSKRSHFSTVSLPDGSIVLMGGENAGETKQGNFLVIDFRQRRPLNDVWRSTDKGSSWQLMTNNAEWSPRMSHQAVALSDGSILLMGGTKARHTGEYQNDIWRSTDKGASWKRIGSLPFNANHFSHISAVTLSNNDIVVIQNSKVWRSTDRGASFKLQTDSTGWDSSLSHSTVALPDGSILLVSVRGWAQETPSYEMWRSKDNGATWDKINLQKYWKPDSKFNLVSLSDGTLVIMGGWTTSSKGGMAVSYQPLNEVWSLSPVN